MKKLFRVSTIGLLLVAIGTGTSCMTTYDAYGRPVQSVDPGLAVAGVAAAGILGMAVANNHNHNQNHYYGGGGYYRPRGYGGYHCR